MGNERSQKSKTSIRELEDFKKFQQALTEGFVIRQEGTELTNPALLDLSQEIANALFRGSSGVRQKADTVNQFRKFFNEVRALKELVNTPAKLGVELRMLRARMGYAAGRQTISEDFSILINDCIDTMLTRDDFQRQIPGFCDLFESLYAYYYYHTKIR